MRRRQELGYLVRKPPVVIIRCCYISFHFYIYIYIYMQYAPNSLLCQWSISKRDKSSFVIILKG